MKIKVFLLLFTVYIGLSFYGCGTPYQALDRNNLKENQKVSKIILLNGKEINFSDDPLHYALYKSGKIERFTPQGKLEHYDPAIIKSLYFYDGGLDPKDPALWIISGALLLIISYFSFLRSFTNKDFPDSK